MQVGCLLNLNPAITLWSEYTEQNFKNIYFLDSLYLQKNNNIEKFYPKKNLSHN